MNIELNLYEAELLAYTLAKEEHYRETRNLYAGDIAHIKNMLAIRQETYKENLINELKKQYRAGETPSTASLQRQEGIGYSRAAKLIEQAKSEVELENRFAQIRKEQE